MIEKLPTSWTNAMDIEAIPDVLNEHAKKINEIIDKIQDVGLAGMNFITNRERGSK